MGRIDWERAKIYAHALRNPKPRHSPKRRRPRRSLESKVMLQAVAKYLRTLGSVAKANNGFEVLAAKISAVRPQLATPGAGARAICRAFWQEAIDRRVVQLERVTKTATDTFFLSRPWRELRYRVLKARGRRCECCGRTPADGVAMHVDHIKPRSLRPDLALVESNLQILCADCNTGKSNYDEIDWRTTPTVGTH